MVDKSTSRTDSGLAEGDLGNSGDVILYSPGISNMVELRGAIYHMVLMRGPEAVEEMKAKLAQHDGQIDFQLPCGHVFSITEDLLSGRDQRCPHNGICGAKECWLIKFQELENGG